MNGPRHRRKVPAPSSGTHHVGVRHSALRSALPPAFFHGSSHPEASARSRSPIDRRTIPWPLVDAAMMLSYTRRLIEAVTSMVHYPGIDHQRRDGTSILIRPYAAQDCDDLAVLQGGGADRSSRIQHNRRRTQRSHHARGDASVGASVLSCPAVASASVYAGASAGPSRSIRPPPTATGLATPFLFLSRFRHRPEGPAPLVGQRRVGQPVRQSP